MANLDTPMGFRPYLEKANENVVKNPYTVSSTASVTIKLGDAVMIKSDGTVDLYDGGSPDTVRGFAAHNAAASQTLYVWDDCANQKFYGQCDDTTGTLTAATDVNLNANILRTASGSSNISLFEIDESSGATDSTRELKILGLYPAANNAYGQFNKLIVKLNRHCDAPSVAGV